MVGGRRRPDVKEAVILLITSRESISNAMGVRFTKGMAPVSLALKRCVQDRFSPLTYPTESRLP